MIKPIESFYMVEHGTLFCHESNVRKLEQEHKEALQRIEQLKILCNTYTKRLVLLGEDDVIWLIKGNEDE